MSVFIRNWNVLFTDILNILVVIKVPSLLIIKFDVFIESYLNANENILPKYQFQEWIF